MPVILRVAASLSPWNLTDRQLEWLEVLIDLWDRSGQPETGLSTMELVNHMARKTGKKVADETARVPILDMCRLGLAENRQGNFLPTGAGRKIAQTMGKRARLWGALLKLVETGKLSPDDVMRAVKKGYKGGAQGLVNLIGKEE